MGIHLQGIVVIAGNYGSGKTEVTVNLAINQRRAGRDVRVADLDLVNPYFRTREVRAPLKAMGIEMVLPPEKFLHADLPILTPGVSGLLRQPAELTLLDVGGDDAGATVLSALADAFKHQHVEMLQVINPFRPFTQTAEGCRRIQAQIEVASRLAFTGLVANTNLIDETTVDGIYRGYDLVSEVAAQTSLALICVTVPEHLLPTIDRKRFSCPVLSIVRHLVPPWKMGGHLLNNK